MKSRSRMLHLVALALLAGGPTALAAQSLTGAGATFPNPVYTKWFDAYSKKTGAKINYQSVGSGAGIRQYTEGTVDFGATDGPMSADQMNAVQGQVVHIPTVMGAVVLTWNLPSLGATQLKFDGPAIADIFLGKITKWNDKRIAALNPGVKLPDLDVIVVHRSDGSGTSYIFTDFLSKVSPEWKQKVGSATLVNCPVGTRWQGQRGCHPAGEAGRRNAGLRRTHLCVGQQTSVRPDQECCWQLRAAVARNGDQRRRERQVRQEDRLPGLDHQRAGAASYPISSFTWLLVRPRQQGSREGQGDAGLPGLDDHAGGAGDGRRCSMPRCPRRWSTLVQ